MISQEFFGESLIEFLIAQALKFCERLFIFALHRLFESDPVFLGQRAKLLIGLGMVLLHLLAKLLRLGVSGFAQANLGKGDFFGVVVSDLLNERSVFALRGGGSAGLSRIVIRGGELTLRLNRNSKRER